MLKRTLLSTAAMLLIVMPALAQAPGAPATGGAPATMAQPQAGTPATAPAGGEILPVETSSQIRAEALIGKKAVSDSGEELGTVNDIVLGKDGMVSGLVLKTGGVMGIGGKSVAVAWRDVGSAIGAKSVTLPVSKDQLERAPEFTTKEDQSSGRPPLPRLLGN